MRKNFGETLPQTGRSWRALAAMVLGIFLVAGMGFSASAPANADPDQVQLDSITWVTADGDTVTEFADGTVQWLKVEWSIPGTAQTPVVVSIDLPATLVGQPHTFFLGEIAGEEPDENNNIGSCTVTATTITCELKDEYVVEHADDMHGNFMFQVRTGFNQPTVTTEPIDIDGTDTNTVTVNPRTACTGQGCIYAGTGTYKNGDYDLATDIINWSIYIDGNPQGDGVPVGTVITVQENWDANVFEIAGPPQIQTCARIFLGQDNRERVTCGAHVAAGDYSISADGRTLSWVAKAGSDYVGPQTPPGRVLGGVVYAVRYPLKVKDGGAAKTYHNSADISFDVTTSGGGTRPTVTLPGEVTRQVGSGGAVGTTNGQIAVTKLVDTSALDSTNGIPTSFRVVWETCAEADAAAMTGPSCRNGHVDLIPNETFFFNVQPEGTRMRITEITQTAPAWVEWAQEFWRVNSSGNPIDDLGNVISEGASLLNLDVTFSRTNRNLDDPIYFQLHNTARALELPFEAYKTVENPDGLDLSEYTSFGLEYSWTHEGTGRSAEDLVLELPADGTVQTSDLIPIGAEVVVSEVHPTNPVGATWAEPVISERTFTIEEDVEPVRVEVVNTVERNHAPFGLLKRVSNEDNLVVDPDANYHFDYTYELRQHDSTMLNGSGVVTVQANGGTPEWSDPIPHGASVRVNERAPEQVFEGADWQPIDEIAFTLDASAGASVYQIEALNVVRLNNSIFEVAKSLKNPDQLRIPSDTEYTIEYEYSAVGAWEAGTGEIVVRADGTAVASGYIPHGSTVKVREVTPKAVEGAQWQNPEISPAEFVMDATLEDVQLVTVANTIYKVDPKLVRAGFDSSGAALVGLGALLLAAGIIVAMRKRART